MKQLTKAWAFAALSYDEDKFIEYVRELFDLNAHVLHDRRKTFFSGVVPDDKNGTLYVFNRGTDGADWIGNIQSWLNNFRVLTGPDGVHNGFQGIGDKVVDKFKSYIYKYKTVVISGQSKGAGVTPYECCIVAECFPNVDHIYGYSFAAPPTGNKIFAKRVKKHEDAGRIILKRYNNPGDPIDSSFLRNKKSPVFDGVDVGEEITLHPVIKFDQTLSLKLIKHSNSITNAAIMQMYAINRERPEELYILAEIGKRIVN